MPHPVLRSVLLVAVAVGSALGEDVKIQAMRAGADRVPGSDDLSVTYQDTSGATTKGTVKGTNAGYGGHVELIDTITSVGEHSAWLAGLRYTYSEQTSHTGTRSPTVGSATQTWFGPLTETINVFDIEIGYAVTPSRGWDVEFMPFVGYGSISTQDRHNVIDNSTVPATTTIKEATSVGLGPYWEFGARGSIHYAFVNGLEAGAEVGYRQGRGHSDTNFTDASARYAATVKGLSASATLGYRW